MNMFRDPEALRSIVEAGRQEFARVVRTEFRGLGLSMADIDRIFQVLWHRLAQAGSAAS